MDINILYVHGLNSDGNSVTGKTIDKVLRECIPGHNITVFHPTFPKDGASAIKLLKDEVRKNHINIVIGTSLGGFIALNAEGPYRIVVNPALHPSQTLLKLGESNEVAASYESIENKLFRSIDFEDKATTIGWFANNDEVVQNGPEFKRLYGNCHKFAGQHRMDERVIRDIIVKSVNGWITMYEKNAFESLTYMSNANKLLLE